MNLFFISHDVELNFVCVALVCALKMEHVNCTSQGSRLFVYKQPRAVFRLSGIRLNNFLRKVCKYSLVVSVPLNYSEEWSIDVCYEIFGCLPICDCIRIASTFLDSSISVGIQLPFKLRKIRWINIDIGTLLAIRMPAPTIYSMQLTADLRFLLALYCTRRPKCCRFYISFYFFRNFCLLRWKLLQNSFLVCVMFFKI